MLPNTDNTNLNNISQPKIAGLYARVSTARQEEQETIEPQIDEIKNRIVADGNVIPPENIFKDDGWTGEMLQRPGLDLMRDAAIAGSFQVLYVYDRGRLSRVFAYQEIIIEEIINRSIEFVTLHDVKAQTPEERVLQAMQGVFHEYERVKIAERMRRGKMFKAKHGVMINGNSLYGWNYIKKAETAPARYEINDEQSRVVKMIWEWFGIEGISKNEIIKRLFDQGIPPRKNKSQFWTKGPLDRVLKCESYVSGIVYYNKSEAVIAKHPIKNEKYRKVKKNSRKVRTKDEWLPFEVPKLIDNYALFQKIQERLEHNKRFACKKRKYQYLLSGLTYCECGNRRVGDGIDKNNFYYRCAERIYKFPMKKKCNSKGFNAVVLDGVFWKELLNFLTNPDKLKESTLKWLTAQVNNGAAHAELAKLDEFIAKAGEEETRYAKVYGAGSLDFEQFRDLAKDVKKRKEGYISQRVELNKKLTQESLENVEVDKIVFEAEKVIKTLDLNNKFQVVRDIITKVIMEGGGIVKVKGRLPLFTLNMGYESISRGSVNGNQHFDPPLLVNSLNTPRIPFELIIRLPKPRYERNIVARDEFGRIIHSQAPQSPV